MFHDPAKSFPKVNNSPPLEGKKEITKLHHSTRVPVGDPGVDPLGSKLVSRKGKFSHGRALLITFFCIAFSKDIQCRDFNYDLDCVLNLILSNISNTRKSVSSDFQTLRSGLKKRGAAEFFRPNSKCLDI